MKTLTLSNGDFVKIDDLSENLLKRSWSRLAGRVVSIKSPTFSDILDLATEIGGPGSFASNPGDYRKCALNHILIETEKSPLSFQVKITKPQDTD
jgi:hypothetical protein